MGNRRSNVKSTYNVIIIIDKVVELSWSIRERSNSGGLDYTAWPYFTIDGSMSYFMSCPGSDSYRKVGK